MLFLTFPKTLPPSEPPEQLRAEYLDSCHCETWEEPCSAREEHAAFRDVIVSAAWWLGILEAVGLCALVVWLMSKV